MSLQSVYQSLKFAELVLTKSMESQTALELVAQLFIVPTMVLTVIKPNLFWHLLLANQFTPNADSPAINKEF